MHGACGGDAESVLLSSASAEPVGRILAVLRRFRVQRCCPHALAFAK